MIIYLLVMLIIGCLWAFFGFKYGLFEAQTQWEDFNLGMVCVALFSTLLWPLTILFSPIAVAIWLGVRARRK